MTRNAASADSAGDRSRARSGKGQHGAEIGGLRIEALLDRFGDVRYVGKNGKGLETGKARCPAHKGRGRSLEISDDPQNEKETKVRLEA